MANVNNSHPSLPGLVQTLDTELCADSVEWCPVEGWQDVLLCGTYQLEEQEKVTDGANAATPQTRVGELRVYRLASSPEDDDPHLSLLHCIPMPGVLDIKWSGQASPLPTCALVNAAGQLQVWGMSGPDLTSPPQKLTAVDLGEKCLGLSLDWKCRQDSLQVVASDSSGSLSVYDVQTDVTAVSQWHAHDFEAWICAFDKWNPETIYSGGDDCFFKGWDLRVGTSPIFTNKRHGMGVCSIQSNPVREYQLAVGSYDEELHIWDTRNMKRPLATCNLGGGIWRVKFDPRQGETILTATMYNGFHVVDASHIDNGKLRILAHYESSNHLGYGGDWCYQTKSTHAQKCDDVKDDKKAIDRTFSIATCSFYDHSLQLRRWPE